ncbi:MAG: hypothetical protein ABFD05_06895 [Anaerolineaceae bacterium]
MSHQAETLACFQSAITPSIIRNKTKLATQLTVIASAFCACARETGHVDQPVISVDLRKVACHEAFILFRAKSKNPHRRFADPPPREGYSFSIVRLYPRNRYGDLPFIIIDHLKADCHAPLLVLQNLRCF